MDVTDRTELRDSALPQARANLEFKELPGRVLDVYFVKQVADENRNWLLGSNGAENRFKRGPAWESARPAVCRSLGHSLSAEETLLALGRQLDQTYQQVATNLSSNPLARVEKADGKDELVLTSPDKLEEPPSLVWLRNEIAARLPRVDLPEILLEIAARTDFTAKSEGTIGAADHAVTVLRCMDLGSEAGRDLLHYAPGRVVGFHSRTAGGFRPGEKWIVRETNCETVTLKAMRSIVRLLRLFIKLTGRIMCGYANPGNDGSNPEFAEGWVP